MSSSEVVTIIVAGIAAGAAIVTAWISSLNRRSLGEIHVLVNDRLDDALREIQRLERVVRALKANKGSRRGV